MNFLYALFPILLTSNLSINSMEMNCKTAQTKEETEVNKADQVGEPIRPFRDLLAACKAEKNKDLEQMGKFLKQAETSLKLGSDPNLKTVNRFKIDSRHYDGTYSLFFYFSVLEPNKQIIQLLMKYGGDCSDTTNYLLHYDQGNYFYYYEPRNLESYHKKNHGYQAVSPVERAQHYNVKYQLALFNAPQSEFWQVLEEYKKGQKYSPRIEERLDLLAFNARNKHNKA